MYTASNVFSRDEASVILASPWIHRSSSHRFKIHLNDQLHVFRCVLASLWESMSVRPSLGAILEVSIAPNDNSRGRKRGMQTKTVLYFFNVINLIMNLVF